jgi:3-oxoacyl-[acyl-carrier-protein] synthase III
MSAQPSINARRDLVTCTEIVGTGHGYPRDLVDNDAYLARCRFPILARTPRAALEQATRMKTRHWCTPQENTLTMAKSAVEMALSEAPELREQIDVVIVTSASTMPVFNPPDPAHAGMADLAPLLLSAFGRQNAVGFDLKSVACAGFLRALQVMDGMLANPNYRAGLIVSTEMCSRFAVGETNRSVFCFILSDAAGAVVLKRREKTSSGGSTGIVDYFGTGIVDYFGFMDAAKFDQMTMQPDLTSLYVGGAELGTTTVEMMVRCARTLLERNGLTPASVDWLLPMQTHAGLIDATRVQLEWPESKVLWNGDTTGFSGSASIPSALAARIRDGSIRKGDLVLSLAVGAGLNCAGALYHA